jgi:hypothetical protein
MAVDPTTLEEFDGKQVLIHVIQADGSVKEFEGKVEAASAAGVAFKEKGKRDVDLIEPDTIEEIAVAPTKPKNLPQKKLKDATVANARQHLLDRHGYDRSVVNGMTDEQAFDEHDDIDHEDLGHRHVADDDEEDELGGSSEEE